MMLTWCFISTVFFSKSRQGKKLIGVSFYFLILTCLRFFSKILDLICLWKQFEKFKNTNVDSSTCKGVWVIRFKIMGGFFCITCNLMVVHASWVFHWNHLQQIKTILPLFFWIKKKRTNQKIRTRKNCIIINY